MGSTVLDVPRNLHLKFHQNWASNSGDIANIEFLFGVVDRAEQNLYTEEFRVTFE